MRLKMILRLLLLLTVLSAASNGHFFNQHGQPKLVVIESATVRGVFLRMTCHQMHVQQCGGGQIAFVREQQPATKAEFQFHVAPARHDANAFCLESAFHRGKFLSTDCQDDFMRQERTTRCCHACSVWEKFQLVNNADGTVSFQSRHFKSYLSIGLLDPFASRRFKSNNHNNNNRGWQGRQAFGYNNYQPNGNFGNVGNAIGGFLNAIGNPQFRNQFNSTCRYDLGDGEKFIIHELNQGPGFSPNQPPPPQLGQSLDQLDPSSMMIACRNPTDAWEDIVNCDNRQGRRQLQCNYNEVIGVLRAPSANQYGQLPEPRQLHTLFANGIGKLASKAHLEWNLAPIDIFTETNAAGEAKVLTVDPGFRTTLRQVVGRCANADGIIVRTRVFKRLDKEAGTRGQQESVHVVAPRPYANNVYVATTPVAMATQPAYRSIGLFGVPKPFSGDIEGSSSYYQSWQRDPVTFFQACPSGEVPVVVTPDRNQVLVICCHGSVVALNVDLDTLLWQNQINLPQGANRVRHATLHEATQVVFLVFDDDRKLPSLGIWSISIANFQPNPNLLVTPQPSRLFHCVHLVDSAGFGTLLVACDSFSKRNCAAYSINTGERIRGEELKLLTPETAGPIMPRFIASFSYGNGTGWISLSGSNRIVQFQKRQPTPDIAPDFVEAIELETMPEQLVYDSFGNLLLTEQQQIKIFTYRGGAELVWESGDLGAAAKSVAFQTINGRAMAYVGLDNGQVALVSSSKSVEVMTPVPFASTPASSSLPDEAEYSVDLTGDANAKPVGQAVGNSFLQQPLPQSGSPQDYTSNIDAAEYSVNMSG